ncbi:TetR/AcrR family transcriptional regulator [Sphingobium sp.]|uniref:TetR/AcrR family transcriptional regulator n=1 Tax=Sphingobium sp. TaxID=1912891 RepID=UPI0028BE7417|nr:TetR/AcrR family transcriptional regulator [Sphingobium sp.]
MQNRNSGIRRRGRPTVTDAPLRRAELVAIAADIFRTHGYEGASIDMIAAAAQVSKATIYARFGNKASLFAAVGLHSVASMRSDLDHIETRGRPPQDVLFDFAIRITGEVAQPDRIALLRMAIAAKEQFPELAHALHDHIADTISPLTRYLAALKAEGAARMDDPAQMAAHFINLANGGLRFLLTDDFADDGYRQSWSRQVATLFLEGIQARR